ncbi:MAG TPA: phosphoribosylglycinamide formyltransferase [Ilumatobacter sp.]|nr:phosphoribosylglycinamide formyltransferase [Ilumatobacter sp.]
MYRLAVLVSGNGSNLQAILDACAADELAAEVAVVVSNLPDAYAIERAVAADVPTVVVERLPGEDRAAYDARLVQAVAPFSPDLVVLAGWMRILTPVFVGTFDVINLHPALPGELPGTHAIERAWQEALAGQRFGSGVMVHRVVDAGVDDGPVLASEAVAIRLDDTFDTFAQRIHHTERRLLVGVVGELATAAQGAPT